MKRILILYVKRQLAMFLTIVMMMQNCYSKIPIFLIFRAKERTSDLHKIPDPGTGKGVPLQPLPHPAETHRDRPRPLPHRAPDQDLVPEPEDEAHEGAEGSQRDQ